ncbi:MAG: M23 family metallopeptidase [Bacteroidota bacterium]
MKLLFCGVLITVCLSCQQEQPVLSALFTPLSARAQYERSLKQADFFDKDKFAEWDSIANLAFTQNVEIPTPYRQTGYFLKGRAEVLAYEIPLKEGEQIDIYLSNDSTDIQVFMDFFQKKKGDWYPIMKSKTGQRHFHFEVPNTETYLLRIQPEFHKAASYELKILKNPVYAFPVAGKGNEDVWSFFGDPRGGGKRKHKGIDIFAKRGTPLLAATDGRVVNVSDRGLGGKQVWIRDSKTDYALYYAHLHKQLVREGQKVVVGDTIGTVGNTGNARTTAPHLHFGIYRSRRRGAVNPLPFVKTYKNRFLNNVALIKEDVLNKGVTLANTNLRSKPSTRKSLLKKLESGLPIELLGASGRWYHVKTMDGEVGFIHYQSVQQLKATILNTPQNSISSLLKDSANNRL